MSATMNDSSEPKSYDFQWRTLVHRNTIVSLQIPFKISPHWQQSTHIYRVGHKNYTLAKASKTFSKKISEVRFWNLWT